MSERTDEESSRNTLEKHGWNEGQINPSLFRRKPQYCMDSSQKGTSEHHQQHQNPKP